MGTTGRNADSGRSADSGHRPGAALRGVLTHACDCAYTGPVDTPEKGDPAEPRSAPACFRLFRTSLGTLTKTPNEELALGGKLTCAPHASCDRIRSNSIEFDNPHGRHAELHRTRGRTTPAASTHPPETAATVGRSRRTRDDTVRALCSRFGDRNSGSACMRAVHDVTGLGCSGG